MTGRVRDESHLTVRPNVCTGERLEGRLVSRGGSLMFLATDGRVFPVAERPDAWWAAVVNATVVVQHGGLPRAYDVEEMGGGSRG